MLAVQILWSRPQAVFDIHAAKKGEENMAAQSLIDAGKAPIIAYNNKDWKAAKGSASQPHTSTMRSS
jgi:hypothetical protein